METYERIRELRKNHLHLSQTEFGERLGVSRSVINNIELNALAKPESKVPLLRLICKEFKVSEEWLLNGTEPMFAEPESFSLDEYARERHMSGIELDIIKAYLDIDEPTRKYVLGHFREKFEGREAKEKDLPSESVPSAAASPRAEKAAGRPSPQKEIPELAREIDDDILMNLPPEELEKLPRETLERLFEKRNSQYVSPTVPGSIHSTTRHESEESETA